MEQPEPHPPLTSNRICVLSASIFGRSWAGLLPLTKPRTSTHNPASRRTHAQLLTSHEMSQFFCCICAKRLVKCTIGLRNSHKLHFHDHLQLRQPAARIGFDRSIFLRLSSEKRC